jgi:ABC-type proline/glycine betaine transport system substrate-binding protein
MNQPKSAIVISPVSTTNAATATGSLDTLGYDYVVIDVMTTTSNNATNNLSVLKLEEGDTTASYAAVKTGDTDFTIAAASTTVDQVVAQFRVDMRGRKRHLKLTASPLTTQTIWAHATMFRGDVEPVIAANANVGVMVDV